MSLEPPSIKPKYPKFRVIAIPAIGGDSLSTWRRSNSSYSETRSSIYQPLDDDAYIHLYSFEDVSKSTSLEEYAESLFRALDALLAESTLLPIHFAAYSTGGLVLKIAIKKLREKLPKNVVDCFHSVAFFGVPHHGSPMISNPDLLPSERLQHILLMKEPMYPSMRGQFTEEKNILERYNSSFLPCSKRLRRIWNFVETRDTPLLPSNSIESNTPVTPISRESRESMRRKMGRIVKKESATFCAGHRKLHNEVVVYLHSDHSGLPHFQNSDAAARAYIEELQSFVVEFSFKVDIHSFSRGETDRLPFHAMPSMTQLLRDGPSECLRNRYSPTTMKTDTIIEESELGNEEDIPGWTEDIDRPRLSRRRRSTKDRNQTVDDLLENGFRWIHVPCNHMSWVREVLQAVAHEAMPPIEHGPATDTLHSILDWKWWESKQNIPSHGLPHARFMEPSCRVFPSEEMKPYFEEEQVLEAISMSNDAQLFLYMPYLHWDTFDNLQKRNRIIEHVSAHQHHKLTPHHGDYPVQHHRLGIDDTTTENAVAMKNFENDAEYLNHLEMKRHQAMYRLLKLSNNMPLHPRRSLDQYGHPFLENMSAQDEDQVLYKCEKLPYQHDCHPARNVAQTRAGSVLMVDQLWCWVVDSRTVVTFFSGTENALEDLEELQPRRKHETNGNADPADVRRHIYDRLTNHPRIPSECKTIFDIVAVIVLSSVSALLERSGSAVDEFSRREDLDVLCRFEEYISYWNEAQIKHCRDFEQKHKIKTLNLRIKMDDTFDTLGYIELLDVKDELQILLKLMKQQHQVITRLEEYYSCMYRFNHKVPLGSHRKLHPHRLLGISWRRIEYFKAELGRLRDASQAARESYKTLFDMKQVQANLYEALYAREANRTLMVFTIVTVVFSPLSFFSSIFGVNAREWGGVNKYPRLANIMAFTFGPSAIIIAAALFFAFTHYGSTLAAKISIRERPRDQNKRLSAILLDKKKRKGRWRPLGFMKWHAKRTHSKDAEIGVEMH